MQASKANLEYTASLMVAVERRACELLREISDSQNALCLLCEGDTQQLFSVDLEAERLKNAEPNPEHPAKSWLAQLHSDCPDCY